MYILLTVSFKAIERSVTKTFNCYTRLQLDFPHPNHHLGTGIKKFSRGILVTVIRQRVYTILQIIQVIPLEHTSAENKTVSTSA